MRESAQTSFVFVLHPEAISIKETRRAIGELSKLGIHNYRLIINSIIPPEGAQNALFAARAKMQAQLPGSNRSGTALPETTHDPAGR